MTTVAWDGKTLAADKRSTFGGTPLTTTKIRRTGNRIYGCAGNTARIRELWHWLDHGADPNDMPEFQRSPDTSVEVLLIEAGVIWLYENSAYPTRIEEPFMAIGSGAGCAMAAMHCGKTAKEAIEIAGLYDTGTGNGVDTLE